MSMLCTSPVGSRLTTPGGVFQVSIQHASRAEWEAVVAEQQSCDGILRLKGLPAKAGVADVEAFFAVRPSSRRRACCRAAPAAPYRTGSGHG